MLFNQWTGTGRLGRDPEMSYTSTGKAVTKFSIAVDQGKDQPTMWLNIVTWERLAERVNEQFHKGAEVFIQGRLVVRPYEDKSGVKRSSLDIVATGAQLTQKPVAAASASVSIDEDHLDGDPF